MRLTNGYKIPQIGLGTWRTLMKVWLLTVVLGLQACSDNDDNPVEVDVLTISGEMATELASMPTTALNVASSTFATMPMTLVRIIFWERFMSAKVHIISQLYKQLYLFSSKLFVMSKKNCIFAKNL